MIGAGMYTTIETLWKQGNSKRGIARITGHNYRTVTKVISRVEKGKGYVKPSARGKKLDCYADQIMEYLEKNLSGVRIAEELQKQDASIRYNTLKKYIRALKGTRDICVRFHTKAGEEAQVDFGYVGLTRGKKGKHRKTYVFNMRLSYSRLDYYEVVYDQKVATFIECHMNAFEYFGGVPKYVRIDNLKAAILEAHFYEPIYQEQYAAFAKQYGFSAIPCRVRKPQEKGKVEAGIKYVKKNFFAGRTFEHETELQKQLRRWCDEVCNQRIHGTTRKIPRELFESEERGELREIPEDKWYFPTLMKRTVYRDCHVYIGYNYYSVPAKYVGKGVIVELREGIVYIRNEQETLAVHTQIEGRGKFSTIESHYPQYKNIHSTAYRASYQQKMARIGVDAESLFAKALEKYPYGWQRMTQGILDLSRRYGNTIVNAACKRALAYQAYQYRTVKNICENGVYTLPICGDESMGNGEEVSYA